MPRFIHAYQLYSLLPMKHKSVLPDEGFGPIIIHGFNTALPAFGYQFICKPVVGPKRGRQACHRVLVKCPMCHRFIPFGRYNQHYSPCNERKI